MSNSKEEVNADAQESRMWKRIKEILKDCDGPKELADDLEELIHLAVVKGGAEGDGLHSKDCNTLYWPWELMRAFRQAHELRGRTKVFTNELN